ncbi:S1C family serine protease, partial [Acinetobacter pittii]|uniref:S1C family serine protease n=1 Tax=Acinetobacter pittii TaxID=48296 RepID=UPI00300CD167
PRAITPRGPLDAEETNNINVFRKTSPSVVHITNLAYQRDFFSMRVTEQPQGTGTGFIWDEAGHIVTNNPVVAVAAMDNGPIVVVDHDRNRYDAEVVGRSPIYDLAV